MVGKSETEAEVLAGRDDGNSCWAGKGGKRTKRGLGLKLDLANIPVKEKLPHVISLPEVLPVRSTSYLRVRYLRGTAGRPRAPACSVLRLVGLVPVSKYRRLRRAVGSGPHVGDQSIQDQRLQSLKLAGGSGRNSWLKMDPRWRSRQRMHLETMPSPQRRQEFEIGTIHRPRYTLPSITTHLPLGNQAEDEK